MSRTGPVDVAERVVSGADIPAFERGFALMGSGGGGQTDIGARLLRRLLDGTSVRLVAPSTLPPSAQVLPVCVLGSTALLSEQLPRGDEFATVVDAMAATTGRPVDAVMPLESAGVNGLMALVAAAQTGLPIVDADLMGRAYPRLDQVSVAALGLPVTPFVLADARGRQTVLQGVEPAGVERVVRALLAAASGWAAGAAAPIDAGSLEEVAVVGSVSRALFLGSHHLAASADADSTPEALAAGLDGSLLAVGPLVEVLRSGRRSGFGGGAAVVRDRRSGALLHVEMENEFLLALRDGEVVASVPDVLCVVDQRTGRPLGADLVRVGYEVGVLHLPGAAFWRRPDTLASVSPRAFGIDHDPVLLRPDAADATAGPR